MCSVTIYFKTRDIPTLNRKTKITIVRLDESRLRNETKNADSLVGVSSFLLRALCLFNFRSSYLNRYLWYVFSHLVVETRRARERKRGEKATEKQPRRQAKWMLYKRPHAYEHNGCVRVNFFAEYHRTDNFSECQICYGFLVAWFYVIG